MDREASEPGVNAFRFITMLLVVLAHSWWFAGPIRSGDNSYLLLIVAQCSVPTFFITSGYLLRWREGNAFAVARWSVLKLVPLYLLWAAICTAFAWVAGMGSLVELVGSIGFGAPTLHLWFVLALALALAVTSLSLRLLGTRLTWILAGVLGAVALLNGTYQTFLGLEAHPLRANVLIAPLLVLLGIHIRESNPPRSLMVFGALVLLTYWLQVWDDRLLASAAGYSVEARPQTTLATIFYALSVFLFARSLPATRAVEWLARRKDYLVVIYCAHPMVLIALGNVWDRQSLASVIGVTITVYAIATVLAALLAAAHRRGRGLAASRGQLALSARF